MSAQDAPMKSRLRKSKAGPGSAQLDQRGEQRSAQRRWRGRTPIPTCARWLGERALSGRAMLGGVIESAQHAVRVAEAFIPFGGPVSLSGASARGANYPK